MADIIRYREESLENIHESLVNGQRKQMVEQIDAYGPYDFWADYKEFLLETMIDDLEDFVSWYTDAVISYFRIKGR